ncbi:GNAT family N-acetyltransferase [Amycolatopsis saalfeldensis]|nr:GNAT family N-acetyltransferase [Amycolatopsis saalfeldensis]
MPGWTATTPATLAGQLIEGGARLVRASHRMTRDLSANRPPSEWADLQPSPPLRPEPLDHPIEDLLPAWRAAYPPEHPDYRPEYDETDGLYNRFRSILATPTFGSPSPLSAVISDNGQVVAGLLVNLVEGPPPWGGPLITDLFRHPSHPGTGAVLLRRTLARAAADGYPAIGLVVTDANPARRLYERHGFEIFDSPVTVRIP